MTIKRGEAWGEPIRRPADLPSAATDAALAVLIEAGTMGAIALAGGDLHASIGSPTADRIDAQLLPIDVLDIRADDRSLVAVAHVLVRRHWWWGPIVAVCNVDRIGSWDVAPRAHPNDGRFDVIEVDPAMTIRQRWQARRRVESGTHLPHPQIAVSTAAERTWTFERPRSLWVDGRRVGDAHSLTVTIRPDAATIVA